MFKAILPSKRISSSDFTMVAGPGIITDSIPHNMNGNGKENFKPDSFLTSTTTNSNTQGQGLGLAGNGGKPVPASKGIGKNGDRHKGMKLKSDKDRDNEALIQTKDRYANVNVDEPVMMEDAFDRLLVRIIPNYIPPLSALLVTLTYCIEGRPPNPINPPSETSNDGLDSKSSHAQIISSTFIQPKLFPSLTPTTTTSLSSDTTYPPQSTQQ